MTVDDVPTELLTLSASAVLGFLAHWFWFGRDARRLAREKREEVADELRKKQDADDEKLRDRVVEIERQLGVLGYVSEAFQKMLVGQLTHLHTPRVDELLAKLGPPCELTDDEETELLDELAKRAADPGISDSERVQRRSRDPEFPSRHHPLRRLGLRSVRVGARSRLRNVTAACWRTRRRVAINATKLTILRGAAAAKPALLRA